MAGKITAKIARTVLRYEPDSGKLFWIQKVNSNISIGDEAGSLCTDGYIHIGFQGRYYLAHRLAWLWMTGEWPEKHVDHRDTNRANNIWTNLRLGSRQQNAANSKNRNSTGFKGVTLLERKSPKKWRASIRVAGKLTNLGHFTTPEAAHAAYIAAAKVAFGEFARAA